MAQPLNGGFTGFDFNIGSGLIGKRTPARRLKINSARWRERMGAIRCLQYSGLWGTSWEFKLAA